MRVIDHIVYATPHFEDTIKFFQDQIGVTPEIGGRHLNMGTKNALLNLGNKAYLEILAIDLENTAITSPRWMGIDLINEAKCTRWALSSAEIQRDASILKSIESNLGNIIAGSRKLPSQESLNWRMTMPLAEPEVDVLPFFLDWSDSAFHPCDQLLMMCSIKQIAINHPNPLTIQTHFDKFGINQKVGHAESPEIKVLIVGPKGEVLI